LFLTVQELELMRIVWDLGEASVTQVRQRYLSEHKLAYTTVMTVLSRLEKKGMLRQRKVGKAFFYSAAHSRTEVAEVAVATLARIFFDGSEESMASFCRGRRDKPVARASREVAATPIDEALL
jgi:predicted transcriptional regulator